MSVQMGHYETGTFPTTLPSVAASALANRKETRRLKPTDIDANALEEEGSR